MKRGRLITIGSFDGVHLGHRSLIDCAVTEARRREVKSLALTFSLPPRMVLSRENRPFLLSDPMEKEFLLRRVGLDEVAVLSFEKELAEMKAFRFFRSVLMERLKARGIVVGADFRFGADRGAGALELVRWGQDFHVPVWVMPQVKHASAAISSTSIRAALEEGRYAPVQKLMGHPYLIRGRVVPGRQLGRKLGAPTANLETAPFKVLPRGVYAVRAWWGGEGRIPAPRRVRYGVANIGVRPTVEKKGRVTVETHLFGPAIDLTGRWLFVELLRKIRDEKRFASLTALQAAIGADIRAAKRVISSLQA